MKVKGKVVVVTGGGSGIGREIVLNLISKEAKVIAVDINWPALQETLKLSQVSGSSLSLFAVDITDSTAVDELVVHAVAQYGHVDAIINIIEQAPGAHCQYFQHGRIFAGLCSPRACTNARICRDIGGYCARENYGDAYIGILKFGVF
jgi:hypothetical protein